MKRRVFLSLLLTAVISLVLAFALVGCQDLTATDVTTTDLPQTATSGVAVQTDSSAQAPASTPATSGKPTATTAKATTTTAKATTTTVKLVGQLQTQLTLQLAPKVTRYEDTDPLLKWSGAWHVGHSALASGGSYQESYEPSDSLVIKFQGTSISLVAMKNSIFGMIKLTLDGVVYIVDAYAAKILSETVWSSPTLTNGLHQLLIEPSGAKSPGSQWFYIGIDAVDVVGKLVP